MARPTSRLSARTVSSAGEGYHADGNGLYLSVSPSLTRSWVFRYQRQGRRREMGLGSAAVVTLAAARERVRGLRLQLVEGKDPLLERAMLSASRKTFGECAEAFIALHESSWRNADQAIQWRNSLASHGPRADMPIDAIDTAVMMNLLQDKWSTMTETASRVRGRIERILDWARVSGFRTGENPARWRGHLDKLLPNAAKVKRVKHHAAMPYADVPTFMATLAAHAAHSAIALRFTILTAARTDETRGATWSEFDLDQALWTIPGERMKMGRPHTVPLAPPVVDLLRPLPRKVQPFAMSENTMLFLMQKHLNLPYTVHGFRSAFRDWVSETTNFAGEVAEMALAHAIKRKEEAAYRRGALLAPRRELMNAWADFCVKDAV